MIYFRLNMSILQGLLNKVGLGASHGRRPLRVFLLLVAVVAVIGLLELISYLTPPPLAK